VLASLWPGDCQSCGTSLGSGKPALMVDDLQVLTRANLPITPAACRSGRVHRGGSALLILSVTSVREP